ncbi:MAG: adenine phosphoribosyltransferase [Desulfovibrionaceae bacterium]|nr:adenine phosphoribosyltransferase [Desulfovibrionaceae bacterium]MDD4953263.1 adenine phosphoribosyltransferase [Desulfovibrionaceae bacterium]
MDLRALIREVKDFPKEGIVFLDITPMLLVPDAFRRAVDRLAETFEDSGATKIVAAEARGFIFGAPLAYKMGLGFVPIRKHGKLPHTVCSVSYDLEYGTDTLCMHDDAIAKGERVLVIDDLLATGGTCAGMIKLVETMGGVVAGIGFLIELGFLNGREKITGYACHSLMTE